MKVAPTGFAEFLQINFDSRFWYSFLIICQSFPTKGCKMPRLQWFWAISVNFGRSIIYVNYKFVT